MNLLELHDISNKLVGIIGDAGLSVEEAKRLTIGVELVATCQTLRFHYNCSHSILKWCSGSSPYKIILESILSVRFFLASSLS